MRLSVKANVLIDQNGHARLADSGLLAFVSDPANLITSSSTMNAGAARWMSPELVRPEFDLDDSKPTRESDSYSLGMVILEVLSSQAPFTLHEDSIIAQKVIGGQHPERPEEEWFTDDLWRTLEQCWSHQPGDRPMVEAVLERLERVSMPQESSPPSANDDGETCDGKSVSVKSCYCMFRYLISSPILTFKLSPQRVKR